MRYTGPRNRLARREGADLGLKTPGTKAHASLLRRLNVPPGQPAARRRRKVSERGIQLRQKQKLRRIFSVTEKQLKNYFVTAKKKKGNTGQLMCQFLERRLDNVVYRLGFAPTRASARQLVSHRHIKVNDKIISAASYRTKSGDMVAFAKVESSQIPYIQTNLENKTLLVPSWLEKKGIAGRVKLDPASGDIEKQVDLRSVIEFYSR